VKETRQGVRAWPFSRLRICLKPEVAECEGGSQPPERFSTPNGIPICALSSKNKGNLGIFEVLKASTYSIDTKGYWNYRLGEVSAAPATLAEK
jgi:hypothetical protein